jgi:Ala-tRNA(Pro) deacylase
MLELGRRFHKQVLFGTDTMRVAQFLADQHIAYEEMLHPPAFTSQKLAKSLHISGRQVVKSILLKGPQGFFLAVLPAPKLIDLAKLSTQFAGPVRLATVAELCEHFADCEWGALMPFGRLYGLTTILEATIPLDATIVFEAQQHALAIRMMCRDYLHLERPERLFFARDHVKPEHRPQAG